MQTCNNWQDLPTRWATEIKALSVEETAQVAWTLAGAMPGVGDWALSCGFGNISYVIILFECEMRTSLVLIAYWLETVWNWASGCASG